MTQTKEVNKVGENKFHWLQSSGGIICILRTPSNTHLLPPSPGNPLPAPRDNCCCKLGNAARVWLWGETKHLKLTVHHFQTNLPAFVAAVEEKCRNLRLSCQLIAGRSSAQGRRKARQSGIQTPQAAARRALPAATGASKCSTNFPTHSSSFLQPDSGKSLKIPVKPGELGLYTALGHPGVLRTVAFSLLPYRNTVVMQFLEFLSPRSNSALQHPYFMLCSHKRQGGSALGWDLAPWTWAGTHPAPECQRGEAPQ